MSGKRIVKNTLFLYVLTFSNYFIGLLLFPVLSRTLSVEMFGLVGFAMAYALLFQVIVDFGFMISATADIAKNRRSIRTMSRIISDVMYAKVALSVVAVGLCVASAALLPMVRDNLPILLLFLASSALSALLPDFYYRGIEAMKIIAIRTLAIKLCAIAIIVTLVHGDQDVLFVPLGMIIGNGIAVIVTAVAMRRDGIVRVSFHLKRVLQTLRGSSLFFVSRLAVSVNQAAGSFFLSMQFTPLSREIGVFSGASRLAGAGEMALSPVVDGLYPHMVHKKDYRMFWRVLVVGVVIWAVICGVIAVFAEQLCVMVLGVDFAESGVHLRTMMVGVFLALPNMMMGYNALSPLGAAKHANLSIVISAGINIGLFVTLYGMSLLTPATAAMVIAGSNGSMLIYRSVIFYRHYRSMRVL
ncbi:MAG: oligosaccharide flippase family protein [Candidatus Saccharibacteria bacterium]|nr:oligosaccharide flippase family protein [Candidatus Saccharibacteria bacterium]